MLDWDLKADRHDRLHIHQTAVPSAYRFRRWLIAKIVQSITRNFQFFTSPNKLKVDVWYGYQEASGGSLGEGQAAALSAGTCIKINEWELNLNA